MEKIKNIQGLRGVAVLSVVLLHLMPIEQKYGGSKAILPSLFHYGMFGVDLFFVISGFVMVAVTRGKFKQQKHALHFIYHRASRIYPTYWFYSIIILSVFLIRPSWLSSDQGIQTNILASFLLLPSHTVPLVWVGWTLIHEMYFYIIFFLILLLFPERKMPMTVLVWAMGVLVMNICFKSSSPIMSVVSHPLTIEFIGGCFIALLYFKRSSQATARSLIAVACFGFAVSLFVYACYQKYTGQIVPLHWWRLLIFGVPALLIVYCFVNAEKKGFVVSSPWVAIGNASYSIYLSHILTISAAGKIWGMFANNAVYDNVIMVPVLFFTAIIVGVISYYFVEKPLLGLSRKIA
ncbi:MAG: acyltransferase [Desulfatitalea sp.]|nr:acyltransferase [Desulfatitalea sp.]NNK01683.1 acyltransferase [Desulfatitalea sp.]